MPVDPQIYTFPVDNVPPEEEYIARNDCRRVTFFPAGAQGDDYTVRTPLGDIGVLAGGTACSLDAVSNGWFKKGQTVAFCAGVNGAVPLLVKEE